MRKIIALLLTCTLVISGCSPAKNNDSSEAKSDEATVAEEPVDSEEEQEQSIEQEQSTEQAQSENEIEEKDTVSYIYTNLHLPVVIIGNSKGKSSIQINGLIKILSSKPYNNLKSFAETYSIEYDKKNKALKNFKLFIIMDTDDCSEKTREDYITGKLFEKSCLKDYIVPIYNSPNLEEVMIKAGIMAKRIPDSQKGSYYSKVFPINQDPVTNDTLEQIRMFSNKLINVKETNLLEYVDYCMSLIDQV